MNSEPEPVRPQLTRDHDADGFVDLVSNYERCSRRVDALRDRRARAEFSQGADADDALAVIAAARDAREALDAAIASRVEQWRSAGTSLAAVLDSLKAEITHADPVRAPRVQERPDAALRLIIEVTRCATRVYTAGLDGARVSRVSSTSRASEPRVLPFARRRPS